MADAAALDVDLLLASHERLPDDVPAAETRQVHLPATWEAAASLGMSAVDLGEYVRAERLLLHACGLAPERPDLLFYLAVASEMRGQPGRALACLERADRLDVCHRAERDRYRLTLPRVPHDHDALPPLPPGTWDGGPLAGRTLLVEAAGQGGVGDAVQWVRHTASLREGGARVLLACPPRWGPLLSTCPGVDALAGESPAADDYDLRTLLRSLPAMAGDEGVTFPYLAAEPARVERWRAELSGCRGLRVGVNWHGNVWRSVGHDPRAVPLAEFCRLAALEGVTLVCLQQGAGREQLQGVGFPVVDIASQLDHEAAFVDTAAVMKCLDLVISTDTSTAHVAGALGVPVWVLVAHEPEWQWDEPGEQSRLYPSARVFRQERPGDWSGVFRRVAEELEQLRAEREAGRAD